MKTMKESDFMKFDIINNRKVKKIMAVIISAVMIMGCMTACSGNTNVPELANVNDTPDDSSDETVKGGNDGGDRLSIVTTIFPEYDWVREIMGDKFADADVTMLLDNGVDLHSYQPTAQDILKIGTCDLFIYVGGESDEWVDDALKEAVNKDMKVIDLLDILGDSVKEEEMVEGMEEEEEEENDEEEEGPEYDEHVWLSLKNTQKLCSAIAETLEEIDPDNAEMYKTNVEAYNEKLTSLDIEYQNAVDSAANKTLLFGDRFPFRYMVDDYGLSYYAAFVGCSAETEASFETITFLSSKIDELELKTICTLEGTDHKIAETIKENTQTKDQDIISFNSLQSVTSKDVEEGAKYLSIMEENLEVMKQALK